MNLPARIPRATYRVQLHADFTFEHLARLVPYLSDLGISDVYLSPIFRAAPGSTHGYDVCDPNEISEELGGIDGLRKVSRLLQEHGMGLVLDFVPNHMGIQGSRNWRWVDVLENGPSSRFAGYFDIEWNPRQTALQDRILLPLLHDFYGRVLEEGEIRIRYIEEAFWACYRSLRFPLRPESYGEILRRLAWLKDPASLRAKKLERLSEDFRHLPGAAASENPDSPTRREEELTRLRHELTALLESENLQPDLDEMLEALNGKPGQPDSFDSLHQILEEQFYRFAYWKTGTHEINYRRFFAIDTLVGLRMESPEVFTACHQLLQTLIRENIATGVRIDHIDGLLDPAEYLERLRRLGAKGGTPPYTLVEKILTQNEVLDETWATHGTTGYDFAGSLIDLLIHTGSESEFTRIYGDFTGLTVSPDEQAYRIKLYIMEELFPNAIDNLAAELEANVKSDRRWRDWTVSDLRPALARIIACLSVYRTYRIEGHPLQQRDLQVIEAAVAEALRLSHSSNPQPYLFIRDLWAGRYPDERSAPELKQWAEGWVCKLQQYTGAIMAKSVEDTFFYRYVRLFAANEVGHHPAEFGRPSSDFHEDNLRRLRDWPASMLATSTHDTKMSEDVRARLLSLSGIPDLWEGALRRWGKINHTQKALVHNQLAPDANEEYLLYQILLGAWPLDAAGMDDTFVARIQAYLRKALSESKAHTNWASPNEPWLKACEQFVRAILDPKVSEAFLTDFQLFAEEVAWRGMMLSLVQTALKLTCPGVPDFYQGTDLWDFSLVDPDNRRPVDYELRQKQLRDLGRASIEEMLASWKDGRIKMYLIRTLLRYRQNYPDLFSKGTYMPMKIGGPHANRFMSFCRQGQGQKLLVTVMTQAGREKSPDEFCAGTILSAPGFPGTWRNLLTGSEGKTSRGELPLETLFDQWPISLLVGRD